MDVKNDEYYNSIEKSISVIYRKFNIYINNAIEKYNLTSSQYIVLLQLYKTDCVNQEYLAKALHIDKGATARTIKLLEMNGYVYRKTNPNDRRSIFVCLTQSALNLKVPLLEIQKTWNGKITENIDERLYLILHNVLKQISEELI